KVVGIAYETVQMDDGSLPLLVPMSEIAGKMSVQVGCRYLEAENGGSGILLGGVPGTEGGKVTIVGGGVVGINAAKIALGMGAKVTILDISLDRLRYLDDVLDGKVVTLASNSINIANAVAEADLVVGAVLIPGAKAPHLVTRDMIKRMRKRSVIVDVAIDQGGCIETSIPTTYDAPVFEVDGITQCCIANIPSAVGRTATFALCNATLPYILSLADAGYEKALLSNSALRKGLNVFKGKLVNEAVAQSLGLEYTLYEED
ncbi:MAG: alanine dehydrogenase, partial [Chloroflexota bacterium]|nr:alanine dehydrogenase [Chloroflexota bacterium]